MEHFFAEIKLVDLLSALTVYCVSLVMFTESIKRSVRIEPIYLSWIVGAITFVVMWLTRFMVVNPVSVLLFVLFTVLTNKAYENDVARLKSALRWLHDVVNGRGDDK